MAKIGHTLAPKSDQLNADDLISGPRTVKITSAIDKSTMSDQSVWIYFEGDNGRPFKPCKTVRRHIVALWGDETDDWAGKSMTLYRDEKVVYGGEEVGGIRVSHMSHIDQESVAIVTTIKRGKRAPVIIKRLDLADEKPAPKERGNIESALKTIAGWAGDLKELRAGLNKYEWTKEERAQIKDALEGKANA